MRLLITGIWLKYIIGWRMSSGESYLNSGNVIDPMEFNLDALGLLTSASIEYKNRPQLGPYSTAIKVDLLDDVQGWQELALCRIVNFSGYIRWKMTLSPVEDIEADAFYLGDVPPLSSAWEATANLYGTQPLLLGNWTKTNQAIMSEISGGGGDATWGVDANSRAVFGPASAGTTVLIPQAAVMELTCEGYELGDYLTEWVEDPGKGWRKKRGYSSIGRPRYAPKKGAVLTAQFKERTGSVGAPISFFGVVRAQPDYPDDPDNPPPNPLPTGWVPPIARALSLPGSGTEIFKHKGTSKILYLILDVRDWYIRSAHVETNESNYKGLEAKFSFGFRIDEVIAGSSGSGYPEIILSEAAWLSKLGEPDPEACQIWYGGYDHENTPPKAISGNLNGFGSDIDRSILVPQRSSNTIQVLTKNAPVRLKYTDVGKITHTPFNVDKKLFSEDLSINKDTGLPTGIGSTYYLHIAIAWGCEEVNLSDGSATVTFLAEAVEFKEQVILAPDLSSIHAKLNAPTIIGPIWSGWVAGALIPPANMVTPDGTQHVAASQVMVGVNGTRSRVRTLTAPVYGTTQQQYRSQRRG